MEEPGCNFRQVDLIETCTWRKIINAGRVQILEIFRHFFSVYPRSAHKTSCRNCFDQVFCKTTFKCRCQRSLKGYLHTVRINHRALIPGADRGCTHCFLGDEWRDSLMRLNYSSLIVVADPVELSQASSERHPAIVFFPFQNRPELFSLREKACCNTSSACKISIFGLERHAESSRYASFVDCEQFTESVDAR